MKRDKVRKLVEFEVKFVFHSKICNPSRVFISI